ncbi:MAG: tetratricopeptide repeat protein [Candidatus Azobacteroides sp.]|nr:tetratricopeptide repeat protein [Candidatus Azobacteroides sp.]
MRISKIYIIFSILSAGLLFVSCGNKKNTASNRFIQSFNTRYNVYFNAEENYKKALKSMNEGYTDDYTQLLPMYPVSNLYNDKEALLLTEERQIENSSDVIKNQTSAAQGSWDYTIEKCQKAIKLHSITVKPPKKRGQKNNKSYQEFMARTEYNPFLHNAWMLMAKARFYKGQFLTAASTFNYIARIYEYDPDIASEARIWAARSYKELGWGFEAEDILNKLNNDKLPHSQSSWFSSVYADYLISEGRLREAIPYLEIAAKKADTRRQKARMTFLLGQIYSELGDNENAYRAFVKVPGFNPPYELEFNARIKQTEVFPEINAGKILGKLNKMSKSSKNENYLDQIYYAIGNIYLSQQDTTKAIENYLKGVDNATRSGMEKAILQIQLGDVYFQRQQYVEAQPSYSEAMSIIQKTYKDYERIARLSETLDELVEYVKEVQLQDSLQRLAAMPESERIATIEKLIADIEKQEREERERLEREERLAANQAMGGPGVAGGAGTVSPNMLGGDNSFYFYNQMALNNGRTEFQRKWGRRKLEDNWRRRDKASEFSADMAFNEGSEGVEGGLTSEELSGVEGEGTTEAANDTKSVEYYLQQIPLLPEQLANSNAIVADGYFNMALIYKNKLEDYSLAINEFNKLDNRYPENDYRLEAYYNMFLMYLKMGDRNMADIYKSKLIAAYPQSDYALAIGDPNFEYTIRMMDRMQDSLYEATYQAYMNGNVPQVRANYETARQEYPLSKLMPKFMLLDAFTYASTGDADQFKKVLNEIVEKYPESDVNQLVGDILKGLARGRQLAKGPIRGMLWNMRLGGDDISFTDGDSIGNVFNPDPNVPYLVAIVYPAGNVDTNELLFGVASYNFTHILTRNFDLDTFSFNDISMVLVKSFVNFEEVSQYYQMFMSDPTIAELTRYTQPIIISESNFDRLIEGYSIAQYMDFYDETFGLETPVHINEALNEEELEVEGEEAEAEKEINEADESESEPEIDLDNIQIGGFPVIIAPNELPAPAPKDTTVVEEKSDSDKIDDTIEDVLDKIETTKDDITNKAKQTWNDLLYGKPELTDEEKEEDERIEAILKAEKEEKKALEKEAKEKAKAEKKIRDEEEKARRKTEADAKKEADRLEKEKIQAQKDEQKAIEKAKSDAEKEKERLRKEALKEKENARKQKEKDRKEREKERKELQKQKEKERREKLKERERQRKEAEKNKNAARSVRK